MNPWMAHLENQDLDWMVEAGRGIYADPEAVLPLDQPMLVLAGTVRCGDRLRGPGALLGAAEWYLDADTPVNWTVEAPLWGLSLPLQMHHRADWAVALAVALSAETRVVADESEEALADGEAAGLKFRYVLNRLDHVR